MDSNAFLERAAKAKPLPIYAVHGDEDFLKRRVLAALRTLVLGAGDDSFGLSTYPGDKATFAAVNDELHTLPFLAPRRLVIVESADPFVTNYRASLEKLVAAPPSSGTLVLEVKSWPANTKLAKLLGDNATLSCKAPTANKLSEWCVQWMARQHGKQLALPAARLLVDLIGAEMGVLDQEMAKLAVFVGDAVRVDSGDVDRVVGSSRMEPIWRIFDALGAGKAGVALTILDGLFEKSEEPIRILGAFSLQLRRLAQAYRRSQQGLGLGAALEEAGILPFATRAAEQQLRQLGRARAEQLYDWLLEVDLGLKGSSQLPERTQLERFVVRLAAEPRSVSS